MAEFTITGITKVGSRIDIMTADKTTYHIFGKPHLLRILKSAKQQDFPLRLVLNKILELDPTFNSLGQFVNKTFTVTIPEATIGVIDG